MEWWKKPEQEPETWRRFEGDDDGTEPVPPADVAYLAALRRMQEEENAELDALPVHS